MIQLNRTWFLFYGRKLGMNEHQVHSCPVGRMLDYMACMQIENGANQKLYATMDDLEKIRYGGERMAKTDIGPKISVEGEKEYRQQMQNIIARQKEYAAELKSTTASMDENTSAEQRASSVAAVLRKQIRKEQAERYEQVRQAAAAETI